MPSFKSFEEMQPDDYAAIGFKSGLEIHQQLLTTKKLFCRCPAGRYSPDYDAEILRHMRPTLSELGEYDGTALMEFKTKKEIIYQINRETVCTYEMDDTPPFELNEEALDIALGIAMLYNCVMVDELHIARKQYLDGSIPTGFQRTTIVGVDGAIPYKDRSIRIIQLGLEEDACREVSDIGHRRVYLTDRLGMPLIETVTGPDLRTPQEVAEVAQLLRRMVRSTGRVRTGIGAAREDVNVSVTGGTRIEIKGVARIPQIPLLTYNEAMRQWNLLRLRDELGRRGITPERFKGRFENVNKLLRKTRFQPIAQAIAAGMTVNGVVLQGFRDLLRWPTQTDTFFAREISDRVRVVACLTTLPNIIHSDSPGETLASSEWLNLRKLLGATEEDTLVLVWGPPADAETGACEILIRAREATVGVPSETRQALEDGTNGFERILPGPDRMYPDTDLPPKAIPPARLERIRAGLPAPVWEREARYRKLGLPADTIAPLSASRWAPLFEQAIGNWGVPPKLAAVLLIQYPKRLRKRSAGALSDDFMADLLKALGAGRLQREGILPAMRHVLATGEKLWERWEGPATETELISWIAEARIGTCRSTDPAARLRLLMGRVMAQAAGRVKGAELAERLRRQEDGR
ncbi:MAG TPA: Glu-tRNA(Gln) amidotransferase subunit GatE [bacterium]|nr:Glu-tRNA(Gln) amidotransferase subunit GatE [bacterium]HQG44683.1 Glu-tRNA(Gln) amidotransferase subunit GatE [bacterium]HQJ65213.1 Glu-tRNA(Gln) amidotransferase subunit GatE [bacterium]